MSEYKMRELNIYQRINEVKKSVNYAQKDSIVQGYKAVTHDYVTALVRDLCVKHGVMIFPDEKKHNIENVGKTKSGATTIRYEAKYEISFINIDKPEDKHVITIKSHANDFGDKAPGKALSYAVKNALLKVFQIETGENDESRVEFERESSKLTEKISEDQVKWLSKRIKEVGVDEKNIKAFLDQRRRTGIEDINGNDLRDIEIKLNQKEEQNRKDKEDA